MAHRFEIRPANGTAHLGAVAGLLRDYEATLPVGLGYQAFDDELADLPGKYAPPAGELLMALDRAGVAIGCVALRALGDGDCEMKRLYLAPAARGAGLGRALVKAVIEAARRRGYRAMRLDTLPGMDAAIALYAQLGFVETDAYYGPTPSGTVFLALSLRP